MRIGIDARFYGATMQGLGRYTENLIRHLSQLDTSNYYVLFVTHGTQINTRLPKNFQIVQVPYRWYGYKEQIAWPAFLYRQGLSLMHFTHFNVPLLYRKPYVVTIHDLILLHHKTSAASHHIPHYYWLKYLIFRIVLTSALVRALAIVTVSKHAHDDIVSRYPRLRKKIRVIHLGGPEDVVLVPSVKAAASDKPFIIYVGNCYPHKNLDFLIEAFDGWVRRGNDYKLFLVGKQDYFYRRLEALTHSQGITSVFFAGALDNGAMYALLARAQCFVTASLHEGFGLPGLEAMACQTPVLSSSETSLPEIYGDAALYFNPRNVADFQLKLTTITRDSTLRAELIKRGSARVRTFDWRQTAQNTLDLYRSLSSEYTGST